MCLLKQFSSRLRASKDIECYKVFKITKDRKIVSPFHDTFIWTPKTIMKNTKRAINYGDKDCVEGGYFHSFEHEIEAHSYCAGLNRTFLNHIYIVCKCVIPKDSYYYKGWFRTYESFASKNLMIIGRVDDLEIV